MKKILCVLCSLGFLIITNLACSKALSIQKIQVTSTSFENKGSIPLEHACDILGSDRSPPLTFSRIPEGTNSFALILDDPDAPGMTFNHWVIFNIPVANSGLEENIPRDSELEDGTRQGTNGTGQIGYFGPCPPPRETHRYVFKVFALDTILDLESGVNKRQLSKAMKKHILGRGKLIGLFKNNTDL